MGPGDEHDLLAAVWQRRRAVLDEGRPEAVERQHALGKLTARERIARLADDASFREIGGLIQPSRETPHTADLDAPADGVVTGSATIGGRAVNLASFDFTVIGGSNGKAGAAKVARCSRRSLHDGVPLVMLLDGGGHRIQEGLDARHFAWGFEFFHYQAQLSGWVPMAAAVLGPGFAGPSNFAALADFVVMTRGPATMGVAGPALVRAATGEDLGKEELGGARVQADLNGIADLAAGTEGEALEAVRRFLSYLPGNAAEPPPVVDSGDPPDRCDESLATAVPANPRRAYDVRRVISAIADHDSVFEIKPGYARNIVTALARLAGRPVGFVANQPQHLAGTLDSPACEKAAHFVSMCDAFGLPLVFLVDVPGFLVGSAAERSGLARRSGRMLYELGQATVPRCTVVLRKGYGLAYIAMCGGRSFDADLCLAWPTAEISAMSIEGAVDVAYRREIQSSPDPAARRAEFISQFRDQLGAVQAAEGFGVDDVIDPRHTRPILIERLERASGARHAMPRPPKRHGISPV